MEQFLPAIIIAVIVTMVMINQIKRITERLDAKGETQDSEVYESLPALSKRKLER